MKAFASMDIVQQTFPAFGSTAVVAVTDGSAIGAARATVEEVAAAVDLACSRFRDDSEITALNRAEGRTMRVGQTLFEAVSAGVRAARVTDGDVDPTLGSALRALGYDRDFDEIARGAPARVKMATVPGWRAVALEPLARTIRVPRGVELDLGATAKAYAADRAAAAAHEATATGVLVSFGGDIALAGEPPLAGWKIRVTDDHRADVTAPGQWISLRTGGLATSSTQVRRWRTDQGTAHHILNPATGKPAEGIWRTVSVCAATCLDANIASTAAIVRGATAVDWLRAQRLPSRLVVADGFVVHVAGWPEDGEDLPLREAEEPAQGSGNESLGRLG